MRREASAARAATTPHAVAHSATAHAVTAATTTGTVGQSRTRHRRAGERGRGDACQQ